MSKAARELFNQYVLELLADNEKQNETVENQIQEMTARATAADIRLSDIEEEVGQLHEAMKRRAIAVQKVAPPSEGKAAGSAV